MDFGLQLAGIPARDIVETAKKAEAWGYSAVYVPDHWAYERPAGGVLEESVPAWEAVTMLGAIASATSRVRVGALVLCNLFRHPGSTAQAMTTIDHLSGGRAVLGIGTGWTRAEFEMMGAPFPDIKPRLRMLDEAIRAIKALWSSDRATFRGEFYNLTDAISPPKPVQKPHPPVMLGGGGKGLLRIAAREADIINIIPDAGRAGTVLPTEVAKVTDDGFKRKIDFLHAEMRAAGRDPATMTLSTTAFATSLVDSDAAAQGIAGGMGAMFGLSAEQILKMPLALIGTPEKCAAEIHRREREWGIQHLIIGGQGGTNVAERFAREVMPKL